MKDVIWEDVMAMRRIQRMVGEGEQSEVVFAQGSPDPGGACQSCQVGQAGTQRRRAGKEQLVR